ncbi:MAG: DUF402 domain-containing protein [Erysipelotrichaceae bacterium]|nr:DUF402 domain-containing protein [Erysipelotrichaceae bacterium]MDO5085363.1 DUF402 domain-containing protein [Erysipelotrichaceae bacterium]
MLPEIKSSVYIQSFKHDGSLHRTWAKGYVVEANQERIVVVTNKTWVTEADGRKWFTKEPAICFFYTKYWFNIISMIRKTGIYYYCNLASPSLYDGEAIKNIDYDLDIKLYPDNSYIILDEEEYRLHAKQMQYPNEIMEIVEKQMKVLIEQMETYQDPFNEQTINYYHNKYLQMLHEE